MTATDFGSDTLADLERARSIAAALEQENAKLVEFVRTVKTEGAHDVSDRNACLACRAADVLAEIDPS